jgi:VanZ family protein
VTTRRRRRWLAWTPAALNAALIWAVSSMSHPDFVPVADVPFKDKGVHFLVFGVLGLFVAHGARRTWPTWSLARVFALTVLCIIAWGALDEGHQFFVPGRDCDVHDVLADALGGVVGAGMLVAVTALRLANARRPRDTSAP